MLFKGIDLSKAVSGPVQITVMLGDTVQSGFDAGFRAGLVSTLNFLALISVSLFIMNLLPIPVLDGGLVLFALIETIRSRPVRPRIIYNSQFIGIGFIVLLLGIALFSDANYVITGEGCIDEQSGMGKAVGAVLNHAFSVGVPVIGIAGTVITKMIDERFSAVFSIQQAPVSMSDAMDNITTVNNVYFTAKQVAKLIKTTIEKC